MRDINELKNKHRGERCFVIGNGVDLKRMNLNKMKNDVTISCNLIGRLMTPTYLCIADPNVYKKYKKEIDANKSKNKIFNSGPKSFNPCRSFPKDSYVIGLSNIPLTREDKDFNNLHKGVSKGRGTVISNLCLPLAYYMGFKEIYLIGVENTRGHFYTKWNHKNISIYLIGLIRTLLSFELAYLKKSLEVKYYPNDVRSWDWIMRDYEGKYKEIFEIIKDIFERDNRVIYNATLAGVIEVFERVDYDSLF